MTDRRIVVDTNVIVSALLSPGGNPDKVWGKVVSGEYTLCYSDDIYEEYADVLSRAKLKITDSETEDLLSFIRRHGEYFYPSKSEVTFADEDDHVFYDTARKAHAILVTGNKKHYPDEKWIVSPADFIAGFE